MAADLASKLPRPVRVPFVLIRDTIKEFGRDNAARLAAAIAYYAAFSIAPLLLVVIALVGFFWQSEGADVQGRIIDELAGVIGRDGANVIQTMLENTAGTGSGTIATIAGVAGLVWGATRLFAQLQGALNDIWNVRPKPGRGIMKLVMTRVLSFGMVLVLGLLLMFALVVSALLTALNEVIIEYLPAPIGLVEIGNHVVSVGIMTLLFAAIYRFLPDVKIRWRDVWVGAFITAILFNLGKFGISVYLSSTATASTYGAAGSFVLLLLWIYFSSMIFFFGAEFTQVYARHFGHRIDPSEHAIRVEPLPPLGDAADEDEQPEEAPQERPAPPQPVVIHNTNHEPARGRKLWKRALPVAGAFILGRILTRKD